MQCTCIVVHMNEESELHVSDNGSKAWYQQCKIHRLNGPAIEMVNGTKAWYQNDELHRTNGPAIEYADGAKAWLQNNKYHREDGAAMEHPNGDKAWWMNGKRCDDVVAWAKALLHHQGIKPTQDVVDAKVAQVMQQDLFN